MNNIDLRTCNKGDILISSLGGILEYISPTPYKNFTYLDHVVRYVRDIDGKSFPEDCYGTRNNEGLTYPNNPKPETDHDVIGIIEKTIAAKAPIIRIVNDYLVLAQSISDLNGKINKITKGKTFGFYTVDSAKPKTIITELIETNGFYYVVSNESIIDGDWVVETSNFNEISIFSEMSLNQKSMGCKKIVASNDINIISNNIFELTNSTNVDDINNISHKFYKVFDGNTQKKYDLRVDLDKYVKHAIYSHVCAYHDIELTFEQWLKTTFK